VRSTPTIENVVEEEWSMGTRHCEFDRKRRQTCVSARLRDSESAAQRGIPQAPAYVAWPKVSCWPSSSISRWRRRGLWPRRAARCRIRRARSAAVAADGARAAHASPAAARGRMSSHRHTPTPARRCRAARTPDTATASPSGRSPGVCRYNASL
jgi:hypothetical protein